jgi:hypothetical protein
VFIEGRLDPCDRGERTEAFSAAALAVVPEGRAIELDRTQSVRVDVIAIYQCQRFVVSPLIAWSLHAASLVSCGLAVPELGDVVPGADPPERADPEDDADRHRDDKQAEAGACPGEPVLGDAAQLAFLPVGTGERRGLA